MQLTNSSAGYGSITKTLHWSIFVLFTVQFVLGFAMTGMAEGDSVLGGSKDALFDLHRSFGLVVLLLIAVRVWWRLTTPLPPWSEVLSGGERRFAHWVELGLYTAMIVKPISGYLFAGADGQEIEFFGLFEVPGLGESGSIADAALILHMLSGLLFLLVWPLHVGLMVRHTVVRKNRQLHRMWPGTHQ